MAKRELSCFLRFGAWVRAKANPNAKVGVRVRARADPKAVSRRSRLSFQRAFSWNALRK